MDKVSGRLTVFFEEAKDYEIYGLDLKNYYRLRFSPAVVIEAKETGRNPKRVQDTDISFSWKA